MRTYDKYWLRHNVAKIMAQKALESVWHGHDANKYFTSCTHYYQPDGVVIICTRDQGYHSGGWWKNPDYERCWHVSISFVDVIAEQPKPKNEKLTTIWLELLFGDNQRLLWAEPPYTSDGKKKDVWHYRLFCDEAWQPILPRGEVYSRQFTERGWKSFTELYASTEEDNASGIE